jgi:hypothetical protein
VIARRSSRGRPFQALGPVAREFRRPSSELSTRPAGMFGDQALLAFQILATFPELGPAVTATANPKQLPHVPLG